MKNEMNNSRYKNIIELTDKSDEIIIDNKQSKLKNSQKETEDEDEDTPKKFQNKNKEKYNKNKNEDFKREAALSTVKYQIKNKFSLDKLGKIKWAKEHASANRPMNKLKEFNKNTKFCNCCNLPCETPGVIQPFSSCEKSENFSICGRAVPSYFYFIKYCIYCLFVVLIMMSLPLAYFNYGRSIEIKDFCINIQNTKSIIYD